MSNDPRHRYPGLNAFSENDGDIFRGREEEVRRIFTKMILNPTLVLHAESGVGKSSLIEAGLLPYLKKEAPEYIPLVFKGDQAVVRGDRPDMHKPEVADTFGDLFNRVKDLVGPAAPQLPFLEGAPESVWTLAKRAAFQDPGRPIKLLLIFDQFENFQLLAADSRMQFTDALAELIAPDMPASCYDIVVKSIAAIAGKAELSPERRKVLNDQLGFLRAPLETRVLFSVREDKLGTMTLLSEKFPDILRNDMTLSGLSRENAKKAISEPASAEGDFVSQAFKFAPEAIESLIGKLSGNNEYIDPMGVQIVCRAIEKNVSTEAGFLSRTYAAMKREPYIVKSIPDIHAVISGYYADTWSNIFRKLKIESQAVSDIVKKIILEELVYGEHRVMVPEVKVLRQLEPLFSKAIDMLLAEGLVKRVPIDAERYLQLCHDRFIKPVLEDLARIREYEAELKHKSEEEHAAKRRVKTWKTVIIVFAAAVIAGIVLLGWNAKNLQQERNDIDRQRMLDVARIAGRSNPQLAFLIARDWVERNGPDTSFRKIIDEFRTDVKQTSIFYSPSAVVATRTQGNTLELLNRSEWTTWDVRRRLITKKLNVPTGAFLAHIGIAPRDSFLYRSEKLIGMYYPERNTSRTVTKNISRNALVRTSADGRLILAGGSVYTTQRKMPPIFLKAPKGRIAPALSAVFFHDDQFVAIGYADGAKLIFRLTGPPADAGRLVVKLASRSAAVNTLDVDDSGRVLVAGNDKNEIEIWHLPRVKYLLSTSLPLLYGGQKRQQLLPLKGHSGSVTCVSVSADGHYALSGGIDGFGILWDIRAGKQAGILWGMNAPVTFTGIDSTGQELATATDDGRVFFWSLADAEQLYRADRLNRFSPLDYYNAGLGPSDHLLKQFSPASRADSLYRQIFDYFSNLPGSNRYQNDNFYQANLRTALNEAHSLYQKLPQSKDYRKLIDPLQSRTIHQMYLQLELKIPELFADTGSDEPEVQHRETGKRLRTQAERLGSTTDLSDINSAVNTALALDDLGRYYRDTLDVPEYTSALKNFNAGADLIDTFITVHPNDPDLGFAQAQISYNRALTYLYMKRPQMARLEANKFNLYHTGQGLANLAYILIYLLDDKTEPAETLFLQNEHNVVWEGDQAGESLKERLTELLLRMRSRHIATPASNRFLIFLQNRKKPTKLNPPRRSRPKTDHRYAVEW